MEVPVGRVSNGGSSSPDSETGFDAANAGPAAAKAAVITAESFQEISPCTGGVTGFGENGSCTKKSIPRYAKSSPASDDDLLGAYSPSKPIQSATSAFHPPKAVCER